MRLMYVHAYQSYVWNVIASERVRAYGLKTMVGDLVYDKQKNVVVLNDANIISYTIEDVILPLPGYSITYPNNQSIIVSDFFYFLNLKFLKNHKRLKLG